MKKILDKRNMTQEDWQEYRRNETRLGGSDASVILGLNPYKSAFSLWLEKTGQVEPPPLNNEYIEWGNILEPVIREKFKQETGFKVFQNNFVLQHDDFEWMIANVDGEVIDPRFNGKRGILEIKTTNERNKKDWEDGCPNHYMIQIQHYLAVTGYEYAYVVCLIGGHDFRYFLIHRDEYVIDKIIEAELAFMYKVEMRISPEISGSESDSKYLAARYPEDNGEEVSFISPEVEDLALEYNSIQKQIKGLQEYAEGLKNRIRLEAKENKILKGYRATINMPTVKKMLFDSKGFQEDHPELYELYKTKESNYRGFTVKILED